MTATTTDEALADLTRGQLLERCKARGLKATGWKKERMLEELLKLAGGACCCLIEGGEVVRTDDGCPAHSKRPGVGPGKKPAPEREPEGLPTAAAEAPAGISGWCNQAPMWSLHHLGCRNVPDCRCGCHEPGWERPAAPEGAASKFTDPRALELADRASAGAPNRDELLAAAAVLQFSPGIAQAPHVRRWLEGLG